MWNADHGLEESTIQTASHLCALLGVGGIYQVQNVASIFRGAWNTDKENQVWKMRVDLDHSSCVNCESKWEPKVVHTVNFKHFLKILTVLSIFSKNTSLPICSKEVYI